MTSRSRVYYAEPRTTSQSQTHTHSHSQTREHACAEALFSHTHTRACIHTMIQAITRSPTARDFHIGSVKDYFVYRALWMK